MDRLASPITINRRVRPDRTTFCIVGHQWPKAQLPVSPLVSADEVEQALVGQQYTYGNIESKITPTEELPTPKTAIISKENLKIDLTPKLLLRANGELELRLVYYARTEGLAREIEGWLIDAMTGEELLPKRW